MLFYKRIDEEQDEREPSSPVTDSDKQVAQQQGCQQRYEFAMSDELSEWIWKDNIAFLRDKNIFCHNYFGLVEYSSTTGLP